MTHRFSFLFVALLTTLLFLPNLFLLAQQPSESDVEAIQNEVNNLLSKKMETALKKDQSKADKMKIDLEDAQKQSDNNGKRKSLENFNRNHKGHYQKTMNEAGINMRDVIAKLTNKFPAYEFSIADDFGIAFSPKETVGNALHLAPQQENDETYMAAKGPNTGAMVDETLQQNYQELIFTGSKSVSCSVAGGGSVELGSRSIRANSTGVIAGGCSSEGRMMSRTVIPAGSNIIGRISANVEISSWALGIFGTSVASSHSYITVYCQETNQYYGTTNKFKMVIAPILWYATHNESAGFSVTPSLTSSQGKTLVVSAFSNSRATSILCCGTNSFARVTVTTARFEIVR